MSLTALRDMLQAAAWTPPQRRFLEQLVSYLLPRALLPGVGIDITQNVTLGTLTFTSNDNARLIVLQYDISGDETTAVTTGTAKRTWRLPAAFYLVYCRASLTTASSSGAVVVDINTDGSSVFGTTKLTIDEGEKSSATSVLHDFTPQAIADNAEMKFDVDSAGTGAAGLKAYFVGYLQILDLDITGVLTNFTVGTPL